MATYTGTFSGRSQYYLQLNVSPGAGNIAGNYTPVSWSLYIIESTEWGSYSFDSGSWSVNIGGHTASGTVGGYDFRGGTNSKLLGSGTFNVAHNADGTRSLTSSASSSPSGPLGSASASGTMTLTTIPRASTPTLSPSTLDAGTTMTITTNRASTSFTHDITYSFGSETGTIGTDVGASTTWTPPLSLLSQIPNTTSGQGTITTKTYSGATLIGTKTSAFTLRASASVVPSFTTVTHSEAVASVDTIVGAYVQLLTKLNLAITGAAGVYGSTISSYKITVAGQTINAASGVTPAVLANSGTVAIVGTVTDSRGRSATKTVNVTVLSYAPPSIDTAVFQISRADAGGTVDPNGDRIRIDLSATVQSLLVSAVEKNALTYQVYSRLRGDATWTLKENVSPGGIAFNSYILISPYALENSWEVRVDVVDKFATTAIQGVVATAAIFMHWGAGLGVGKFWEQGGLDVLGQIYQNDGKAVVDESNIETYLPARLGIYAQTVTDFNLAEPNGWTMGANILNAPFQGVWYLVETIAHNAIYQIQTAYAFTATPVLVYRRKQHNGVWGAWELEGYSLKEIVTFTSSGTFSKASYPYARAIRVKAQAGGGAGGGSVASGGGLHSQGGGGGGGECAESLITNMASVASSVSITVGAGGTGVAGGTGGSGGDSSFGTTVVAKGGTGGSSISANSLLLGSYGGRGGVGGTGDLLLSGGAGDMGVGHATIGVGASGGSSHMGGGGRGSYGGASGGSYVGQPGELYGGGGGGSSTNQNGAAAAGAAGGAGIVIVEVYG